MCARFPISVIPHLAWGNFRPIWRGFGAKKGRLQRSGQKLENFGRAKFHPGRFLSIARGPLAHVARDRSKGAFYLVTRRFSNTINQHNSQLTQSTMSSSEGEEFNMDVSGSDYESEPTLRKVGWFSFRLIHRFSHLFNRHPRKRRRCQNLSKAKRRLQRLNRKLLQRKEFSLITTGMLKTVQWMTSEETRLITTNWVHHQRQLFLPRRRRQHRKRIQR